MQSRAFTLLAAVVAALSLTVLTEAAQPDRRPFLIIATGSPGGTYYEYGQGLATLLTRVLDRQVVAQTTDGASENIELIEAGSAGLGFVTMGVALEAWDGSGAWTHNRRYRNIRALFPMFDTPFHFVTLKDSTPAAQVPIERVSLE